MPTDVEYPVQENELVYALDIGTRSVIGILGRREQERVRILAVEKRQHARRTMMDGQIEDIGQVAKVVSALTQSLERTVQRKLVRACVAAAGRALRTERGGAVVELSTPEIIGAERVSQLELAAVSEAEQRMREDEDGGQRLFLVGYTVTQFLLDHYPLASLEGHTGQRLEATVVATFLPSEVVDSLYAVMRMAGLEVASLTLEPIAALNAAIPSDLRLLNLALVDIGAGTSDIALCRDGSVAGYTMATVAGDEITEALMRSYLLDYQTAERVKMSLVQEKEIVCTDILGIEQRFSAEEALEKIDGAVETLVREISDRVLQVNGGPPSALFLAGGGSKLVGLCPRVAQALEMDQKRVALAGRYFQNSVTGEEFALEDPEYTTPLGIVISAGLGLISDSYRVRLNGAPAKLFRSGRLTALELLMMNGYTYGDLLGRSGRSLVLQIDGKRTPFYGEPAVPAVLRINGADAPPSQIVQAGDDIQFQPAKAGADQVLTAGDLARDLKVSRIWCRGECLPAETLLEPGMPLETQRGAESATADREPSPASEEKTEVLPSALLAEPVRPSSPEAATPLAEQEVGKGCVLRLNGRGMRLPPKPDGAPYYLMDLLERSGIDFQHVERPVVLAINGAPCTFQQRLHDHDSVEIRYEDDKVEL